MVPPARVQNSGPGSFPPLLSQRLSESLGIGCGATLALVPFLLFLLAKAPSPGFSMVEQREGSSERPGIQVNEFSTKDSSGSKE